MLARHQKQPLTPILLGLFFAFATLACLVAGLTLLMPGGPLEWVWTVKPQEHRQLLGLAPASAIGFLALSVALALGSAGSFARRKWAWPLALVIFTVNAAGDAARMTQAPAEGLIGVAVTSLVLLWLTRRPIRSCFDR